MGKERLVVDVRCVRRPHVYRLEACADTRSCCSCRKKQDKWVVAMNRWQDLTDLDVNAGEWSVTNL